MDSGEEKYLLGLHQIPGMNQQLLTILMDAFGDAEKAWFESRRWEAVLPLSKGKGAALRRAAEMIQPEVVAAYADRLGVKITTDVDADFPPFLRNVARPPYMLYYFGTLPDPDRLSVAVVGARKCTDYGRDATAKIVTDLVKMADVHIVNGIAEGIDGAALRSALSAGGRPTAVLGCGIDIIYPAFHRKLYEALKEQGCIISEFPFGTPGLRQNFPFRNRLISGLAAGVLVTEATRASGTLHTVNHGLEQGKEIYAMPGSIFSRQSELPHYLIESGQAKFAACAEDILEDFIDIDVVERMCRDEKIDAFHLAADEHEKKVISELQHGRRSFDELAAASRLSAARLTAFLTRLEIEGAVRETPGNTYTLTNQ